jgi:hypothetical protein
MRWVIGIIVVVVLVILGYQYFGDRGVDVAEQAPGTEEGAGTEQGADVAQPADQAAEDAGQAGEEAETATEQAGQAGQQAAEQAQDTAEQAAAGAQQATEEAAQATEEAAQQAQEATDQAAETPQEAAEATAEGPEEPAAGAQQAAEETLTEAQTAALTVGDVNVGEQLTDVMQNTEETLQGITDAQSAEAAVPKLNDINARLEELSGPVGQLPEDAKKVLADVLGKRVTELKTMADKLTAQEGVGDVVRPALEPIMAKLEDWSRAPA